MGMQSYDKKNEHRITLRDADTAKNYLTEDEMKALGLLVEQYLAFAEAQAQQHIAMTMNDWISKLDAILTLNGRELLTHAGSISAEIARKSVQNSSINSRNVCGDRRSKRVWTNWNAI